MAGMGVRGWWDAEHLYRIRALLAKKEGWGMDLGREHTESATVFEICHT